MPVTRYPPTLFLLTLPAFFHGNLASSDPAHTLPTSAPVRDFRIRYVTDVGFDDYDNYEDERPPGGAVTPPRPTAPPSGLLRLCDYEPCLEYAPPCAALAARTRCLCPGLSGPEEPPKPPHVARLVDEGSGGVVVHWCAPPSVGVSQYRVVVEDSGREALVLGEGSRKASLGPLETEARVCIEAVNGAGVSDTAEYSCIRYTPQRSGGMELRSAVIVGGICILVLLALAGALLWKRRACRKAREDPPEGLGNPSFITGGTL